MEIPRCPLKGKGDAEPNFASSPQLTAKAIDWTAEKFRRPREFPHVRNVKGGAGRAWRGALDTDAGS
jgi:hypothetical protein